MKNRMENREIVKNLKKLKEIKPSQEWRNLMRGNLMSQINWKKRQETFNFQIRTGFLNWIGDWMGNFQSAVLAVCFLIIFIGGPWLTIAASRASLPGEFLYSIKRAAETVQTRIVPKDKQSRLQVEFANRRLEEFAKITREDTDGNAKQVISDLKDNLADASVNIRGISKENAIAMAKKTIRIREDIDRAKEKAPIETKNDLIEVEKAIEKLNSEILAVLAEEIKNQENGQGAPTSTEEILIYLEKTDSGAMTTTDKIINGVKEEK